MEYNNKTGRSTGQTNPYPDPKGKALDKMSTGEVISRFVKSIENSDQPYNSPKSFLHRIKSSGIE